MATSRETSEVRRVDILWIHCDPSVGVEPQKIRTCVVVSNDLANQYGQAVTVVPTQADTAERARRAYIVDLRKPRSDLEAARGANASMIMTYDRRRIVKRAGRISADTQHALDHALSLHLGRVSV
ncbi:MAG: type II toxin-antitoxin system PemK/MazF family toxin [Deltaproteobacteria bacterium]|nr:type II toxin-antitoxin system PemK/MazF family toxin [Deltaproteobacteria bacterium]